MLKGGTVFQNPKILQGGHEMIYSVGFAQKNEESVKQAMQQL